MKNLLLIQVLLLTTVNYACSNEKSVAAKYKESRGKTSSGDAEGANAENSESAEGDESAEGAEGEDYSGKDGADTKETGAGTGGSTGTGTGTGAGTDKGTGMGTDKGTGTGTGTGGMPDASKPDPLIAKGVALIEENCAKCHPKNGVTLDKSITAARLDEATTGGAKDQHSGVMAILKSPDDRAAILKGLK